MRIRIQHIGFCITDLGWENQSALKRFKYINVIHINHADTFWRLLTKLFQSSEKFNMKKQKKNFSKKLSDPR